MSQTFQWECQPKAENLLIDFLDLFSKRNPSIAELEEDLAEKTSSRLFDWVDHFIVRLTPEIEQQLEESGFESELAAPKYRVFHHPGAQLPRVILTDESNSEEGVAVSVDSIADYLMARGLKRLIEGSIDSGFRSCIVNTENETSLTVIERRGTKVMEPTHWDDTKWKQFHRHIELWKTRPRSLYDEDEAMTVTLNLAEESSEELGPDLAAWIVLYAEREYWQARNTAGQTQRMRQDRLGMGWANHDHHTFRSSRRRFSQLVRLFEILGFHCRERFYAGEEAGWGAQVMENSQSGHVLFLDVDLAPEELEIDFAHHSLPDLPKLGTVGLWCALHGDSILKAGMHHLESQFSFEQLTRDLKPLGIGMMDPFSDFEYLKQAFTKGEIWPVADHRIESLLKEGLITKEQALKFKSEGAIGSHMENLQRRQGYKGFNQKNVSTIIKKTDPRNLEVSKSR